VQQLADRLAPAVLDATTSETIRNFLAFDLGFAGGVHVATGDVNGDGAADIIAAAGPGGAPHVRVFDGRTGAEIRSFLAYDAGFRGGVSVATGDVNDDGVADIIAGAGAGAGPHVKVFDGRTGSESRSFYAFTPGFLGGVSVAAGDVNGDGVADIIAGAGSGSHIKVFDGRSGSELQSFYAFDPNFSGGMSVAAGDVNGDGLADIIAGVGAGSGVGPHVKVFDGRTGAEFRSFYAFDATFFGGASVSAGDLNGDGFAELFVGAGPGAGPHIKVFDGESNAELRSLFVFDLGFAGGVNLSSGDLSGDGVPDIVVGAGPGAGPHVKVFNIAKDFRPAPIPPTSPLPPPTAGSGNFAANLAGWSQVILGGTSP